MPTTTSSPLWRSSRSYWRDALLDLAGQLVPVAFQSGQFLAQALFPGGQLPQLRLGQLARRRGLPLNGGEFLLQGFGLFHQIQLAVFQFGDVLLAGVNFVGQGAIFLVLFGLELLQGVALDLLLARLGLQLELFCGRSRFVCLWSWRRPMRPGCPRPWPGARGVRVPGPSVPRASAKFGDPSLAISAIFR